MADDECVSGLCAFTGETGVCSAPCDGHDACAPGFQCERTGDGSASVCIPAAAHESTGGCGVVAGSKRAPFALATLSLLGLIRARRRR
jgi:MYXO-CTERM domain-containing protein